MKNIRSITKIIFSFIACVFLCSCAQPGKPYDFSKSDITQYIESFKAKDYAAMYSLCAPAVNIKKEAFIKKYSDIMEGLGVKEISIDNITGPDENGVFKYTATYNTEEYGDFTNDFTLRTGFKDDKWLVLWDYSLIFPELEEGGSVRVKTLKAQRGEMFGAGGELIAENAYADTIYMEPLKVRDIGAVAAAVSPITGVSQTELVDMFNKAVQNGTQAVPLGAFFHDQLNEQQRQSIEAVAGLGIDDKMYTPIRNYPLKEAAAQIAGYIGLVDPENIPDGYKSTDKVGKAGLESAFEEQLRGKDGKIVYIEDRWGRNIRTLYEVRDEQGQDLWLTIKPELQQRAYNALTTHLTPEQTGVAIVMDAKTGYVEAMAAYPSYDNNLFTFPVSEEVFKTMTLFPWATQGGYPPGSVIKPFTATAALEGGVITPETEFEGTITDNKWYPDGEGWYIKRVSDSGWPIKLANAIRSSDNIYFAYVAMKMGEEKLMNYLESIGMEEAVPFDLPVKEANVKNETTTINRKLLADMGYGQGDLLVTPLQLAAMYTALANGTGDMMKPILVKQTKRTEGLDYVTITDRQPEVWKQGAVSESTVRTLLPMLENVVSHGTAYDSRIPGIRMAGKTGTAEIGQNKAREISWYAAFWVDGNYDRLVVVMVDTAAEKGAVKFDIAKALLTP
jgi:cell division protein FtsI/penicillin-binding protein 2